METCTTFCARLQAESSRWWASTNRKSINYVENVAVFIQFCIENEEKLPCFEKEYDGTSAGKQHLFNYCDEPTTGGGGMLLTDDEELAARAKYLSTTAKEPAKWGYYHKVAGWNLRMPGVNAAIGAAQLEYFDKIIENKRETAQMYKKVLCRTWNSFCYRAGKLSCKLLAQCNLLKRPRRTRRVPRVHKLKWCSNPPNLDLDVQNAAIRTLRTNRHDKLRMAGRSSG